MSPRSQETLALRTARWPGVVGCLLSAGLLSAYWFVPAATGLLNRFGELLYLGTAALLALWGLSRLATGTSLRRNGGTEAAAGPQPRWRLSISWLGMFLTLVGVECLAAATLRNAEPASRLLFGAVGLLLVIWGVKEIMARAMPRMAGQDRPQNRFTIPRPGVVYLVIMAVMFVGSLLGRSNMLMLVFALMAGPFALNGWVAFNMLKRTRVERHVPPQAMAGEVVSAEIVLHNRKRWIAGWLMGVRDRITSAHEQLEADVLFARVPPRSARTASYHLKLMQRGIYRLGPILVSTRFPLGLVERSLLFDATDELLIYPRLGRLTPAWKRQCGVSDELVHRRDTRRGVFEDEFHRLREYRWGDNPRAIHWRTSARQNQLMVREYHQSRDWNLLVLLDLWAPRRPLDDDLERVERAASFAATICVDQLRLGRDANLYVAVAGAEFVEWEGPSRPGSIPSLLSMFAVQQAGASPNLRRALESCTARRAHSTRMVLVTTRPGTNGAGLPSDEVSRCLSSFDAAGELLVVRADQSELSQYFVLT